jgi:drug/metabolite transporter (DMT)-like permease
MQAMPETAVPVARPGASSRHPAPWQADLGLVLAAFFFGTTFVVVQDAVARVEPLPFLTLRFLIATLVLGVVARTRPASPGELRDGVAAGAALTVGYGLQTVGLQYTSAATSAFLTYMLVVFVPVIALVVLRRRPHPATLVGIVLALAGLLLLTQGGNDDAAATGLGRGELLTLGCAVGFAAHLVIIGEIAGRHDPVRVTTVQLATVSATCLVASVGGGAVSLVDGHGVGSLQGFDAGVLAAAGFTGLFATALAFLLMVWAQRVVSAAHAALIFLLEPVFAAALGWLTGERLTAIAMAGGGLILIAVLVAELAPTVVSRMRLAPRPPRGVDVDLRPSPSGRPLTRRSRLSEAQRDDPSDEL